MAGNHKMIQVLMRICATLWDEKRVIVDNRFCYISCYMYIISRNISYSSSTGDEEQKWNRIGIDCGEKSFAARGQGVQGAGVSTRKLF